MSKVDRIQTPEFRVSYAHIWTPQTDQETGEKRWSLVAIFDADKPMNDLVGLFQRAKDKTFGVGYGGPCKHQFKDDAYRDAHDRQNGVDPMSDYGWRKKNPEYIGKIVMTLSSKRQAVIPHKIMNNEVVKIIEQEEFYSGCYAIAMVTAFAYGKAGQKDKKGNPIAPGVSFGLSTLVKTRDGEPLVAVYDAADDFKTLAADPQFNIQQNANLLPGTLPPMPAMGQPQPLIQQPQPPLGYGSYTPQQLPPTPGFNAPYPTQQPPFPPQPGQQLPPFPGV